MGERFHSDKTILFHGHFIIVRISPTELVHASKRVVVTQCNETPCKRKNDAKVFNLWLRRKKRRGKEQAWGNNNAKYLSWSGLNVFPGGKITTILPVCLLTERIEPEKGVRKSYWRTTDCLEEEDSSFNGLARSPKARIFLDKRNNQRLHSHQMVPS